MVELERPQTEWWNTRRGLTIHQVEVDRRAAMQSTRNPLTIARFWSKVDVRRPGECWEWKNATNERGYGVIRIEGTSVKAHRLALELSDGVRRDPAEKIRHSCDNPPCCNPAHLEPGTQAQNVADMHERARRRYASRFTKEDIEGMRELRNQGLLDVTIAAMYGCSQSYVSMLITGARGASIGRTA